MPQMILKIGMIIVLMFSMVKGQQPYNSDDTVEDEIGLIERALSENAKYEMHRRALENLYEKILSAYDYYEPIEEDEKRSIATLAKNGQLPSREPETEMESLGGDDDNGHKRNIASMARSGLIGGKRNIQSLARQWQYASGAKRNIGALMRNNMLPGGKRNIASMARNGYGKRNVGTLARDWALPKLNSGSKYTDDGKRNIQALKNSIKGRKKREIGGETEINEPVFQNGPVDYDELLQALNDDFPYAEKRFLAPSDSDNDNDNDYPTTTTIISLEKRHLGSLARSGWAPAFRPTRNRFSRSGRTENMERIVESYYPLDRLRPAPLVGTSCRRCDQDQHISSLNAMRSQWGINDNHLPTFGGLSSLPSSSVIRARSGGRARSPRVAALSWRTDRW